MYANNLKGAISLGREVYIPHDIVQLITEFIHSVILFDSLDNLGVACEIDRENMMFHPDDEEFLDVNETKHLMEAIARCTFYLTMTRICKKYISHIRIESNDHPLSTIQYRSSSIEFDSVRKRLGCPAANSALTRYTTTLCRSFLYVDGHVDFQLDTVVQGLVNNSILMLSARMRVL